MEAYLRVGVVTTTHGVRGEVKVYPTTDDPKRYLDLKQVYVDEICGRKKRAVENVRFFKNLVILKLAGVDDMGQAAKLKGCELYIDRKDAVPLEEGEYYIADLLGMEVRSDSGEKLGRIKDVLKTGANDVYVVDTKEKKSLLIPVIPECVLDINVERSYCVVHLMNGLLDL